jgi:plastocyanin
LRELQWSVHTTGQVFTPPRSLLNLLLVAAACAAAAAMAPPAPQTGRLQGRVTITVPVSKAPPSAAYGARRVGKGAADTGTELTNVVVFLQDVARSAALPATRARIVQENETFVPRVVAITRGSTVDFPNADPFFHDVFSLSRSATFDLGSYPRGQTKSQQFRKAGLIKVYCHIHSHMSASIMVFDHPFFTIPRTDGSFAIDDVPVGSYKVSAWHERIGENTQSVRIEAGRPSEVHFALPISSK